MVMHSLPTAAEQATARPSLVGSIDGARGHLVMSTLPTGVGSVP
jgi:hypothetical protein